MAFSQLENCFNQADLPAARPPGRGGFVIPFGGEVEDFLDAPQAGESQDPQYGGGERGGQLGGGVEGENPRQQKENPGFLGKRLGRHYERVKQRDDEEGRKAGQDANGLDNNPP